MPPGHNNTFKALYIDISSSFSFFFFFFFFFGHTGVGTQGFIVAVQVLYQLSCASSPKDIFSIGVYLKKTY
jgi:hypothetical protein